MISIRPIRESDQHSFYELANNNKDRLEDFFPITLEKAQTIEKSLEAIKFYKALAAVNELHVFVFEHVNDSKPIGMVFIKNIDPRTNKCELAYFIDKGHTNKGYTSLAVQQAIDIAFNKLNLNKVYCRIATDNEASNKLALRSGFQLEGVLRKEYRINNGDLIDLNYYGRLKS